MASSEIPRIDNLLGKPGEPPLTGADSVDAIGAIQDLLRGHGASGLPNLASARYGKAAPGNVFDARTLNAMHKFQKQHNLPVEDTISAQMLSALVQTPASNPLATRAYVTLVLDQPWSPTMKVLSLVAIVEGGGRFSAICANSDKAGLSVGLIQWAQKPGRLFEILDAWNKSHPAELNRIFGGAARVTEILNHAKLGKGGLNADGTTNNAKVDLLTPDALARFKEALLNNGMQTEQVRTAMASFVAIGKSLGTFATKIQSERGLAFMLDLANQHGAGGAKKIYQAVVKDPMTEAEALAAMKDESVRRMAKQFPPKPPEAESVFTRGGLERREFYLQTPLLSSTP